MDKTNKRKEYITNPARIVAFCSFLITVGITWGTLNYRVNKLEEFQRGVDMVKIETALTAMQKDIEYIRLNLNNLNGYLNSK